MCHEMGNDSNSDLAERQRALSSLCGEHAETLRRLLSLDGKDGA